MADAQTLTLANGIQTYTTLTNTVVTMSNRCELRVTGTNNPIAGSTINLNSADAWFFLPNLRPSVVSASYLSQVKVNGANAVAGSNCRLDQYAMGTVIIPHAPGFTPLQVFSGPNLLGVSANFGIYTYYTNTVLGVMRWNISSFRLKRGYSATFAQNADGTGPSKVYVAQDGDLEVGVLPGNLDHQCNFVRVFPWRWTGKKGWDDVGGESPLIKPLWFYDWGSGRTSSLDAEYCPMQWGGGYDTGINGKQKSTHVLGYNEPDRPDQANLSVATAIAEWPRFMRSGLRLGAPAVSDSGTTGTGLSWLYSFISQADALGYRVDYIPVHYYKCGSGLGESAANFRSYLLGVYQTTGRPVWVTEFNYGANWCSGQPTSAEEAARVNEYIDMLESAPFVERYSIFNWVGDARAMITNNVLTPAGVIYRDKASGLAYTQAVPSGGSRSLAQFQFEADTRDSSGYANNGFVVGNPDYAAGHTGSAVSLDGTNNFVQLPPNLANSASFSFAAWVNWNGGANWQRIFDFGDDQTHYLFLSPSSGGGTLRFAILNGGTEQQLNAPPLSPNTWVHVAVTLSGVNARLYTNGVLAASSGAFTIAPSNFNPNLNYLGKSQFADPLFRGKLDEVQIADYAFTAAQIAALLTNTPPEFTTNLLSGGNADQATAYSGSITGTATDVDPGDTLTYSKASGLAWLNVAADGTLSGTPGPADGGTNNFTVRVTDAAGASAYAVLTIITPFVTGNAIWYVDGNGLWSDNTKWTRTCVANGAGLTADFTILDISADRVVTLNTSRSIGALKFGDLFGTSAWTIGASGGSALTLDMASAVSPSIAVENTATISASLAGTNGFTKQGDGTLILSGVNSLSGVLYVDTGSTTASDGAVRLASSGAAAGLGSISIRNNNSGSSTLQLTGGISVPVPVTLSGRTTNVAAIENISGSNLLSGPLSIGTGGGYYLLQSDAGTLNLGGLVSSAVTGTRTFTFQGAGDFYTSGSIQNGSATSLNVTKIDAGTLTLANTNTFTGGLAVAGGSVKLNLARAVENNLVFLACVGSNALKFGPITGATIAGLAGINDVWLTNSSFAAVTLTNGSSVSTEYAGSLRGSGGMVKTGTGTLTLSGTNLYTGATTLSAGTVRFGTGTNLIASLQPVLWMSFDQVGSGVVTNQGKGGWGMNGTILGTGAYVTNGGRFGNALYVDGTGGTAANNIVKIAGKVTDTSASGSWTVGYWIKTTTAGAVILYQGDGGWSSSGQTTYLLNANSGTTPGTKAGAVRWGGGFLTGTAVLNDGNWHFVTLVDTAGTQTIYVDGNADAVTSSMANALAASANQTWIGGAPDADTGAVKINGMIDEVCIFDRALTLAQIRSIFTNAPVTGKMPFASPVSIASGATLNLSGLSQSLATLSDVNGSGGVITNSSAGPVTLILSNNAATTSTFSGRIADASAANAISVLKSGNTTQVLGGTNNYRGTTIVSNGTLIVNGSLGTNSVVVRGGTLAGNGTLAGPVTVYAAATISPGSNSIGVLTINNSLTLAGTTFIELDKAAGTNDSVRGLTSVTYGGALNVANLGGTFADNDAFPLFSAANYDGAFASITPATPAPGFAWNTNTLTTDGTLRVWQTINLTPTNIATLVAGSTLTLSWPADYIGWRLQTQTNAPDAGLGSNWVDVAGSTLTNQMDFPIDPANGNVFYRMIFP